MVPADSDRIPRVPPYSGGRLAHLAFPYQTVTVFGVTFQTLPVRSMSRVPAPTTPAMPRHDRFRLFPFRSPLLRKSIFLSLPAGTKMFQFPALTRILVRAQPSAVRVAPFGHLRIEACLQLPAAFRSLPRPSSSPEATGILRSLLFASLMLCTLLSTLK